MQVALLPPSSCGSGATPILPLTLRVGVVLEPVPHVPPGHPEDQVAGLHVDADAVGRDLGDVLRQHARLLHPAVELERLARLRRVEVELAILGEIAARAPQRHEVRAHGAFDRRARGREPLELRILLAVHDDLRGDHHFVPRLRHRALVLLEQVLAVVEELRVREVRQRDHLAVDLVGIGIRLEIAAPSPSPCRRRDRRRAARPSPAMPIARGGSRRSGSRRAPNPSTTAPSTGTAAAPPTSRRRPRSRPSRSGFFFWYSSAILRITSGRCWPPVKMRSVVSAPRRSPQRSRREHRRQQDFPGLHVLSSVEVRESSEAVYHSAPRIAAPESASNRWKRLSARAIGNSARPRVPASGGKRPVISPASAPRTELDEAERVGPERLQQQHLAATCAADSPGRCPR